MTNITFDEPSTGEVTVNWKAGLTVRNKGADNGWGVRGESINSVGVFGTSESWVGTYGESQTSAGVYGKGTGEKGTGVWGEVTHDKGACGVIGTSKNWIGVYGQSQTYVGVQGEVKSNNNASGVFGLSNGDKTVNGVKGISTGGIGILGQSTYVAILGRAPTAGRFEGDVEVTGDIRLLAPGNADCAEDFDIMEENVDAGTVMILNEMGSLQPSYREYDKKVAGIISGASGYKPAIVLDRQYQSHDENQSKKNKNKERLPIALMGKVYCKVDARNSSIEIGDLLTTSATKGCAMKAGDPMKAFGAVIGKALGSIKEGLGMIPVLVSLQ